ncbi:dihydrolipoamide acetyltransferase family protein [Candidatus Karelsulcia muelleri]
MAEIIYMPRLSDTMKEGTIVKWYKQVGEQVLSGEILAEIETDKAIQEFESEVNATILYLGVKEGEKAKINDMLCILGHKNENIDSLITNKHTNINIQLHHNHRKRRHIKDNKLFISPVAKQMALEERINLKDIKDIKGSGPQNRLVKKDILTLINNQAQASSKISITDNIIIKPLSKIRQIISDRLSKSHNMSPHYYLFIEVTADNLIKFKQYINKIYKSNISFNDLIVKATALSLKTNQELNTSLNKDNIIYHQDINIGIAVSLPEGLIVPVIHSVDNKSLRQISKEIKDQVAQYITKPHATKYVVGSTFTISNLGMFGIDCFTSIINPPNASILSVGSIQRQAIIDNNKIKIGHTIKLTLACDHRLIDGSVGSAFLLTLKEYLLEPLKILC